MAGNQPIANEIPVRPAESSEQGGRDGGDVMPVSKRRSDGDDEVMLEIQEYNERRRQCRSGAVTACIVDEL